MPIPIPSPGRHTPCPVVLPLELLLPSVVDVELLPSTPVELASVVLVDEVIGSVCPTIPVVSVVVPVVAAVVEVEPVVGFSVVPVADIVPLLSVVPTLVEVDEVGFTAVDEELASVPEDVPVPDIVVLVSSPHAAAMRRRLSEVKEVKLWVVMQGDPCDEHGRGPWASPGGA